MGSDTVDWEFAARLGARIGGDGPVTTAEDAAAVVAELRADAARSTGLVREFTGLDAVRDDAPVLVVGRADWVRANADGFAKLMEPVVAQLASRTDGDGAKRPAPGWARAVGSRITGAEVGLLLGFLSSKVLGQFDPFADPAGRLMLVAPNIVHVENELGVHRHDFRLWVCLHEETHRVQFTAVPWMRDHLFAQVEELANTIQPRMLEDLGSRISQVVRGEAGSIQEVLSTPEQRVILDRVTGLMSLLEGHADVVMDDVGPSVIPTVRHIRSRFNKRREGVGSLDRLLRRLLGLDAKMAQYRDGAIFVRQVIDRVGMDDFNAVFAEPANLPSKEEIADPDAWVARVHG